MAGFDTPEKFYFYGILRRDYTALQVAKNLFKCYDSSGNNITVAGGSMGGWQSFSIAVLDKDVNKILARIVWLCQIGSEKYNDIYSWHPKYSEKADENGNKIFDTVSVFSSVTAAHIINERIKKHLKKYLK